MLEELESIMKGHALILETGLRHGEEIMLSKLSREINRVLDATGHSGDYNRGLRDGLKLMQAYIQSEMKP